MVPHFAMYGLLVLLALRNIWVILVRQHEYKNIPILAFYAFSLVAISLRPIQMLGYWNHPLIFTNIDWV